MPLVVAAAHHDAASLQVQIAPAQLHKLAEAQAGAQREEDHGVPLRPLGRLQQSISLGEVQEVNIRQRRGE